MSGSSSSSSADTPPPVVLVFRKRMLPYSETFIAAQGNHLSHWKAVYAGATAEQSGQHLLAGPTCILTDHAPPGLRSIASGAFKRFGILPRCWLRALRSHKASLIHVHFGTDALSLGIPLSKALGIPLVVTFHGYDINVDDPVGSYQRNRPKLFHEATRVIAVSDYIKGKLIHHGCPPEKIVRHYIGIDLEKFTPLPDPEPRKDVVFVGRLSEKKGCAHLIQAMIILAAEGRRDHLHIIGNGSLRRALMELAMPLGSRVTFHGSQNPEFVCEKVRRAAVFCAPSVTSQNGDAEGLGMVNLEAMAVGTPVVSTFHTAIPEAVIHEKTGILVPEADPAALAVALKRCLDDPVLARSLGEKGIAHVRRNFDLRKQCSHLERIYTEAAGWAGL